MDWTAVTLTIQLACCTCAILFICGLPLAYWLAFTRWPGRIIVESFVALPLVLPPTVLGYYLLVAFSPDGIIGGPLETMTDARLAFSFPGILIGSVLCNIPFAVRPFVAAFSQVDRRLIEASYCLGQSQINTFRKVTLPLAKPGILAGITLAFAHSIGEFGVVLMLGGNLPGVTRTLSISIYDDVQALDYEGASQSAIALLLFSMAILCFTQWLMRDQRGSR